MSMCACCMVFRKKDVNEVQAKLFEKKYEKQGKVIDISLLPPCQSVLKFHADRANFVSKMFKSSFAPQLQIPDIITHGWYDDGSIRWLHKEFPENIEELLIHSDYDEEESYILGGDVDSDDEEQE